METARHFQDKSKKKIAIHNSDFFFSSDIEHRLRLTALNLIERFVPIAKKKRTTKKTFVDHSRRNYYDPKTHQVTELSSDIYLKRKILQS